MTTLSMVLASERWNKWCICVPFFRNQLTDWVKILRPTFDKTDHFIDVLPRQSLGSVVKN